MAFGADDDGSGSGHVAGRLPRTARRLGPMRAGLIGEGFLYGP
jgi:hypothetical protein